MDRVVISDFDRHVLAALRSNATSGQWPTAGDVGAQLWTLKRNPGVPSRPSWTPT
jgi:hypothetical protein